MVIWKNFGVRQEIVGVHEEKAPAKWTLLKFT